ncbi:hypothetical protein HDR61_03205 [bacterium]|nr:hypothetical protein [bacterium]
MAMKMDEFLLEFYKRLIFREMSHSVEQFAQYCDYVKADNFNGHMKDWKKLLETNASGFVSDPATGLYKPKDLPRLAELESGDLEKMYRAFQTAFRAMATSRKSLDDKTVKFLDKYFGKDLTAIPPVARMFDNASASPRADNQIKTDLLPFLQNTRNMGFVLKRAGLLNDEFTFKDLIDGIKQKKYNSDPTFQRRLLNVVEYISASDQDDLAKALRLGSTKDIPDLSDISNGFNNDAISPQQMHNFQLNYAELLKALYKEPKILNDFQRFDNGKISKSLTEAKEHLNYNDPNSDDFIKPKRTDELTIPQHISKFFRDTYDEYLDKYISLNGDRFFFSDHAKDIVGGLKKVKPTDGLEGLLKEAAGLEKNLKASDKFKSAKHAKWFASTLTEFSNDKKMSRIFAGALKNSTHMKALIRELIFKAIKEDKIEEAKTAMEVLSVMKYGYTTSKIMDALRKEPVSIFSDKGLSWNKNEGMQFITAAMDRSIKYAVVGLGYGLTFVGNAIRQSHSKIKKTTGELNKERKKINAQNEADKQQLDKTIIAEGRRKGRLEYWRDETLNRAGGRTADAYKQDLNNDMTAADTDLKAAKDNAAVELRAIYQWLATTPNTDPNYNDVLNYYEAASKAFEENGDGHAALAGMPAPGPLAGGVAANIVTALQNMETYSQVYDRANDKLNKFVDAENTIAALSDQLDRHNKEAADWDKNHHDKIEELLNYWNRLEKGRNTHSGPMYSWFGKKKTQEAKFKADRDDMIKKALQKKIKMEH